MKKGLILNYDEILMDRVSKVKSILTFTSKKLDV